MDDDSSWWGPILFGAAIVAFFIFADIRFSIPKYQPMKQKTATVSQSEKHYYITFDEDFVGHADFYPDQRKVVFKLSNISKDPKSLEGAKYTLWTFSDTAYGLEVVSWENAYWDKPSHIFNPGDAVYITTLMPLTYLPLDEVEGFNIRLKEGVFPRKIRFGYERAGWWNRLRWWIAEWIRKDATPSVEFVLAGGYPQLEKRQRSLWGWIADTWKWATSPEAANNPTVKSIGQVLITLFGIWFWTDYTKRQKEKKRPPSAPDGERKPSSQ